jgi:YggT family protein
LATAPTVKGLPKGSPAACSPQAATLDDDQRFRSPKETTAMFLFANFITAVGYVLNTVLWIYMWIMIARAVISWVNPDPYNPIVRFLYNATEPLLLRVRRSVPAVAGGVDLSPLIVLLGIFFLQSFLVQSLFDLAYRLR